MRIVLDWFFKIENKTEEQEQKIKEGVRDTLLNSTMRINGVQVSPHDVFLYDANSRQRNTNIKDNTLCIIVDVETRTEVV